jgi:NAD(P)-dependent dehydrogenase (short-subunit alcohol dehydrogenase family)
MAADLSGRAALITGAASSIGRASVLAFVAAGASVALVDIDADGLADTAEAARVLGPRAEVLVADVTSLGKVTAAVWLCSSQASYITGSVLVADGGWLAG